MPVLHQAAAAVVSGIVLLGGLSIGEARCPNLCSGHGSCDKYLRCTCFEGWMGADCSERACPRDTAWSDGASATDTAHAVAECSNRGICAREIGECICMAGFTGKACQRTACPNDCNHHGRCLSMSELAYQYQSFDARSYAYSSTWDAHKLHGCVCDVGYAGYDCSLKTCPLGDDPLTKGQLNEVQQVKCVSSGGFFLLRYQGQPSAYIYAKNSASEVKAALETIPSLGLGSVRVTFSSGRSACTSSGSNVISIEFLQNFGSLPPLTSYSDKLYTSGYVEVAGRAGEIVLDDRRAVYRAVKGNKENDVCSNRGTCDETEGSCLCFDTKHDAYGSSNGYGQPGTRGDCGYPITSTLHCPGEVTCSGHGKCNAADKTFRCQCAVGWTGGDCSQRTCPRGPSWFSYPTGDETAHNTQAECSDRGICDRDNAECLCGEGFFGAACEYMRCGGDLSRPCNGHGQCLSMAELALAATDNGDATDFTYGLNPNNPGTWDAQRIYGCQCDSGWHGYDCSLRSCPRGDDPGTYGQSAEVQLLKCTATGGHFVLSFRQAETAPIAFDASAQDVEDALSALSTINGGVSAKLTSGTSVCSVSGSAVLQLTFVTVFNNVPAVQRNTTLLIDTNNGGGPMSGTIQVAVDGSSLTDDTMLVTYTSARGTTEDDICSNRGLCDTATGSCDCFAGFSSSDGSGQAGEAGDCGYRLPRGRLPDRPSSPSYADE